MANENNYTNELASPDDDPTAELEALTCRHEDALRAAVPQERDAHTSNLASQHQDATEHASLASLREELRQNRQTIDRLQYDIEHLRSRQLGIDSELEARRAIIDDLNVAVAERDERLRCKARLLRKRAGLVRELINELRRRERAYGDLQDRFTEASDRTSELRGSLETTERALFEQRQLADGNASLATDGQPAELVPESYADALRRKVQDLTTERERLERECRHWRNKVDASAASAADNDRQLRDALESNARLEAALAAQRSAHEEELRLLRFELGEAQDTIAQSDDLNSQLASDLIDTRGFKEELERMLCDNDEAFRTRVEELEKQLATALDRQRDSERKLAAKGDAISVLLGELAKKSEQLESMNRIEEVISDIDERIDKRVSDRPTALPPAARKSTAAGERVSRVLIGQIDGQVVRFPLFKNRLTIGRTDNNDIQLHANWVSRRHAVIVTDSDLTRIIDWGSKNGVFVNSRRAKEHFLSHGDLITIGNARFRYEERTKKDDKGT